MYTDSTQNTSTALTPIDNERGNKVKEFFSKIGKRNFVIAAAVLLIGVAVCLNFVLFTSDKTQSGGYDGYDSNTSGTPSTPSTDAGNSSGGTSSDNTTNSTDTSAQYFASVQVSRQKARDEALQVLASVAENEDASETVKNEALASIAALAKEMQSESDIESLIVAKGFEDCIAIINGDSASIVVKCPEKLVPAQLAQINEIVYAQAGILPTNITIIHRT